MKVLKISRLEIRTKCPIKLRKEIEKVANKHGILDVICWKNENAE
jgi:hypothetical protein